jgi:hypothetical protein
MPVRLSDPVEIYAQGAYTITSKTRSTPRYQSKKAPGMREPSLQKKQKTKSLVHRLRHTHFLFAAAYHQDKWNADQEHNTDIKEHIHISQY